MVTYEITLNQEDADKLGKMADDANVICDLEYLEQRILEIINKDDSARLTHTEK